MSLNTPAGFLVEISFGWSQIAQLADHVCSRDVAEILQKSDEDRCEKVDGTTRKSQLFLWRQEHGYERRISSKPPLAVPKRLKNQNERNSGSILSRGSKFDADARLFPFLPPTRPPTFFSRTFLE